MRQIDFVGDSSDSPVASNRPPKPVRDTRPSTAEEKARMCLELLRLSRKVPASVCNGSVQATRQWQHCAEKGRKVCSNARSSVIDFEMAIKALRAFL